MEHNQDLTAAYVTVKVNGGVNVLRNIFHFNSEAIEDAFRNEFNDMARLTDFVAVSAAQIGASISYAEERDFSPQDAEALLGFKPKNGRHVCVSDTCVSNHYMGEQSIDAIEHTFGTHILNTLAGAVNDGDRSQMLRPKLDTIISDGNDKDGFMLEFTFFVVIECVE